MKVYIIKDGHKVSDFSNERDAIMWLAGGEGLEVAFEPDGTTEYEYDVVDDGSDEEIYFF